MSEPLACTSCGTIDGMQKEMCGIENGIDHSTKRFCSLDCIETFLETHLPGTVVVGEHSIFATGAGKTALRVFRVKESRNFDTYNDDVSAAKSRGA